MFTIVDQNGKKIELTGVESQEQLERLVAQNFPYKGFRLFRDKQPFTWGDTTKPAKLLVFPKIVEIFRVTAILPNGEQATFDCQSDEPFETLKEKMIKSSEYYQSYQVYQNEILLDLKLPLPKQNYQQAPLNVKIVGLRDHQQQIKDQETIQRLLMEIGMGSDKLKQSQEQQMLTQQNLDKSVTEIEHLKSYINQRSEQVNISLEASVTEIEQLKSYINQRSEQVNEIRRQHKQEVELINEKFNNKEQIIHDLRKTQEEQKEILKASATEIEQLKSYINQRSEKVKEIRRQHKQEVELINEKFNNKEIDLRKTQEEQKKILKASVTEIEQLKSQINQRSEQVNEIRGQHKLQVELINEKVNNKEQIIHDLRKTQEEQKEILEARYNKKNSKNIIQKQSLEAEIKQLKQQVRQLQDTLKNEQKRIKQLLKEEQMSQFQNQSFAYQIDRKNKLIDQLESEVRGARLKIKEANEEAGKLKDTNQEFCYDTKFKDSDIKIYQEQIQSLKSQKKLQMAQSIGPQSEDLEMKLQTLKTTTASQVKKLDVQQMETEEMENKLVDFQKHIEVQQQIKVERDQEFQKCGQQLKEITQRVAQKDQEIERRNQIVNQKTREVELLTNTMAAKSKQFENLKAELEIQNKKLKQNCFNLKLTIDELEQRLSSTQRSAQTLKVQLKEEEEHNDSLEDRYEKELLRLKKQKKRLNEQIMPIQALLDQTAKEKQVIEQNLALEKQKNQRLCYDYDAQSKFRNEMETQYYAEIKLLQGRNEGLVRVVATKKQNKLTEYFRNGVVGPIEALFNKSPKFQKFQQDKNVVTDTAEFKMSLIQIVEEEFEKRLTQHSDLNFSEAFQVNPVTTIKGVKTLHVFSEGDQQQIFVLKVLEDTNNYFNGQIFGIKHFKDQPKFTHPKLACQSVIGNLIAKFLMAKYMVKLKQLKEYIVELKYQDLFLLEQTLEDSSKVYYICEKLVPGTFTKYNGCGQFRTGQYSEICNSFTYFSYIYSQRQLLVSNVQGVDQTLYDPTVSTQDGILDDNDLGYDEISVILSKFKESEPKIIGMQYLSAIGIKQL